MGFSYRFARLHDIVAAVPPSAAVPAHLQAYLSGAGWQFAQYFQCSGLEPGWMYVEPLQERFPAWESIDCTDAGWWTETDHRAFQELVDWCVGSELCICILWS
jgi:hypothetical protein